MLGEVLSGIDVARRETDRGAALVGAAMLDEGLRSVLAMYFEPEVAADLLDGNAPLSSFAARVKMAYALTIVEPALYADLEVVRGVRNEAAHFARAKGTGFKTGFDSVSVRDRVLVMKAVAPDVRVALKGRPRLLYELFCFTVSARLHSAADTLNRGMVSGRFGRDNARKGIRAALRFTGIRDGVSVAAASVVATEDAVAGR